MDKRSDKGCVYEGVPQGGGQARTRRRSEVRHGREDQPGLREGVVEAMSHVSRGTRALAAKVSAWRAQDRTDGNAGETRRERRE